jgi:thioredoxin-dependent peroxiredoxin
MTMIAETLSLAPHFNLPATNAKTVDLSTLRGRKLVLYFYPKDNTPGCTDESAGFRDQYAAFVDAGCEIFGISRDGLQSHERFKAKLGLPFELIADTEERACDAFGVMKMKSMYGKQMRGVERSTFVIDAEGRVAREWRAVKVPGHVDEVLKAVRSL